MNIFISSPAEAAGDQADGETAMNDLESARVQMVEKIKSISDFIEKEIENESKLVNNCILLSMSTIIIRLKPIVVKGRCLAQFMVQTMKTRKIFPCRRRLSRLRRKIIKRNMVISGKKTINTRQNILDLKLFRRFGQRR